MQKPPDSELESESIKTRIPANERLVAFGIDFVVCYLIGILATLIPFLNRWLDLPTVMTLTFLAHDYFFGGRAIGKNLFGLQVVDAASGKPAGLRQSIVRNIILILPFIVTGFMNILQQIHLIPIMDSTVNNVLHFIGMLYLIIILPLESYRTYTRPDSLRLGDTLAGTMVVESATDFSQFLPTAKN
jgi:uncharacterized RDD family membrane protein YckC